MIKQKRLVDEFVRLVSIDSPSRQERAMGDYLKVRLEELGFSVEEDDAGGKIGGNCGNLYGYLPGDSSLEPVMFCCHMDTVEPARGKKAVLGEDGRITSAGDTVLGADDVSGIVAVLEALTVIRERGLSHRPLEVLFTVAEEVYAPGCTAFDAGRARSREIYVLDLTGPVGQAAYQAPTILSMGVQVIGKASHAGFAPEQGVHAIQCAAAAVARLTLGRVDPQTTMNIGRIEGGLAGNIVPEACYVKGEVRSLSHDRALELAETVKAEFERSARDFGARVEFAVRVNCRAYRTDPAAPVVKRFERACGRLGLTPQLVQTFGGSDYNVFAQRGFTGIVLANAMEKCHSCQEYTTVEELERIARLTLELMTDRT